MTLLSAYRYPECAEKRHAMDKGNLTTCLFACSIYPLIKRYVNLEYFAKASENNAGGSVYIQ